MLIGICFFPELTSRLQKSLFIGDFFSSFLTSHNLFTRRLPSIREKQKQKTLSEPGFSGLKDEEDKYRNIV
jgi:hypothetical protein